jgi:hypothetical protein
MKPQDFFRDPAIDRLLAMTVQLAAQVQILTDRSRALEGVLRDKGILSVRDVEQWTPGTLDQAQLDAERQLFVRSVFGPSISALQGEDGAEP